ncbi:MAG: hypothetical protein ACJ0QR_02155 [Flavobacteriales bacterium]
MLWGSCLFHLVVQITTATNTKSRCGSSRWTVYVNTPATCDYALSLSESDSLTSNTGVMGLVLILKWLQAGSANVNVVAVTDFP